MSAAPVPAQGAAAQLSRLLRLVPFVYARRDGVSLDEAAAELGVPAKQVLADLKVLFMCGLPGGYPDDLIDVDLDALEGEEGDGMIRVSNADYLSRPLRLDPTETGALIVALRVLHAGADEATREIVDRTIAKLEVAADGAVAGQVAVADAAPAQGIDAAVIERAIAGGRQLRLRYYVPARDEESTRVVDPHRLLEEYGARYLSAYCHSAEAQRSFRLDRIHEVEVLDSPIVSEPPAGLDASLFQIGTDRTATLLLDPAARWITEYHPALAVRETPAGIEVDLAYADPRWLQRLVLRVAPHARILRPETVAADTVERAHRTLALYADGPA